MSLDGKRVDSVKQDGPGHTFTISDLGVSVPLQGVADDAKNQCEAGPCTLDQAHTTIKFSFRTGAPGMYRWQCLVPCAAGNLVGFGGPMQTLGWMDGFMQVV